MIKLYAVRWKTLPQKAVLMEMLRQDKQLADAVEHYAHRREEAAVAGLAGMLLLRYAGVDGRVYYDANGRPCLGLPSVDFNISHTDSLTVCAVSCLAAEQKAPDVVRVGVDAENASRLTEERLQELTARWFLPQEREQFAKTPTKDCFLRLWTAKEAMLKRTGEGLRGMCKVDATSPGREMTIFHTRHEDTVIAICAHANQPIFDDLILLQGETLLSAFQGV